MFTYSSYYQKKIFKIYNKLYNYIINLLVSKKLNFK